MREFSEKELKSHLAELRQLHQALLKVITRGEKLLLRKSVEEDEQEVAVRRKKLKEM